MTNKQISTIIDQFHEGKKYDGQFLYLNQGRKRLIEVYLGDDFHNPEYVKTNETAETWVFITEELLKEKLPELAEFEAAGQLTAEFKPNYRLKGVLRVSEKKMYDVLAILVPKK